MVDLYGVWRNKLVNPHRQPKFATVNLQVLQKNSVLTIKKQGGYYGY